MPTDDTSPSAPLADGNDNASAPASSARRRRLARIVISSGLAFAAMLGGFELWALRSYRATIAALRELQERPKADATLDDAEAAVRGWVDRPFEREETSFREDVTVRWKSLVGNYQVRIHATKKSERTGQQYFTGIAISSDRRKRIELPEDVRPPPKQGPVGTSAGNGTARQQD